MKPQKIFYAFIPLTCIFVLFQNCGEMQGLSLDQGASALEAIPTDDSTEATSSPEEGERSLPGHLVLTSLESGYVKLQWKKVENSISYSIYRNNMWLAAVKPEVTDYIDNTTIKGNTYQYDIRSRNSDDLAMRKWVILGPANVQTAETVVVVKPPEQMTEEEEMEMEIENKPVEVSSTMANISPSGILDSRTEKVSFPGATGHGRFATGGRGGKVYCVNTLSNAVKAGDGLISFREALLAGGDVVKGPRTITFCVSGQIDTGKDNTPVVKDELPQNTWSNLKNRLNPITRRKPWKIRRKKARNQRLKNAIIAMTSSKRQSV